MAGRGLHPSMNTNEIKNEIGAENHCVTNVYKIKIWRGGKLIPKTKNENNQEIYKMNIMISSTIIFELPHKRKDIPHCTKECSSKTMGKDTMETM